MTAEPDHYDYEERVARIKRRYITIQRRTALYGALAFPIAMLLALWIVRALDMAWPGAAACGAVLAILCEMTSWRIARMVTKE